jgi:tRNA modification GTPase
MATGHLAGRLSQEIKAMQQEILAIIAHLEASIDFPEEGVADVDFAAVAQKLGALRQSLARMLATASTGRILKDGLETAIIGKPNVGKSSLLNTLLGQQRAIVTAVPGTTRDSIEEYADIGGVPLRIIDTAGIRATDDQVEKLGVAKSRSYAAQAALILAVFDASQPLTAEDEEIIRLSRQRDAIVLLNKTDLAAVLDKAQAEFRGFQTVISLSTRTGAGLAALTQAITERAYGTADRQEEAAFISDAREADILEKADSHLAAAQQTLAAGLGEDFLSIDLRSAWEKLGEITGETVGEDIIKEIFARFCIGK